MKSFSKRVASFAMAAAMVCSLAVVSPVDAEAAAKPKFEKTRTAITAGTNYTYAVKNVTSKQYVKVYATTGIAVKYNNAKVTKGKTEIKGGKTIKVKINANNKVANYKGKVTVKVFNKKTNKKVKDLSDSFTVKCTKLEVKSVESASTTGKYLVATFSKKLSKLSVADVTIRNKVTGELKGVDAVALASDGKSATITLTGAEDSNNFVRPNVEYTFSVTQGGAVAETTFKIDGVMANASIVNVDVPNRTLTVANPEDNNGASMDRVVVPADMDVDFQKLLGTTATIKFDKTGTVKNLTSADETVIEGAFKAVTANSIGQTYLEDLATGTKYYLQEVTGKINSSAKIEKVANGYNADARNYVAGVAHSGLYSYLVDKDIYEYMKLTLNPNNTVRTAVINKTYDDSILVDKITGDVVSSGEKTAVNLKDFLIVKDGQTIKTSDIVANDVVFYNKTTKFANVYNNSTSGALEGVYDGQFKFGGKIYKTAGVEYVDGTNGSKPVDNDYMNSLLAGKQDITVYFNRKNEPVFVAGTKGTVVTNTTTIVLTDAIKTYNSVLNNYIRIKGFNGTEIKQYDINVGDLSTIVLNNGKKYTTVSKNTGDDNTNNIYYGRNFQAVSFNDADAYIAVSRNDLPSSSAVNVTPNVIAAKKSAIQITTNDKGAIVGVNFKSKVGTVSGNFTAGASKVTVSNNGVDVGDYQISGSAKVYTYNGSNDTVSVVNYADYTQKASSDSAEVYSSNGKDVDYIVVTATADADTSQTIRAVVSNLYKTTDGKVAIYEVVAGTEAIRYETFSDGAKDDTFVTGTIVDIKVAKDGTVLEVANANTNSVVSLNYTISSNNVNERTMTVSSNATADISDVKVATSVTPTIVEVTYDANGAVTGVKSISFNDLEDLTKKGYKIDMSTLGKSTYYVDVIVAHK